MTGLIKNSSQNIKLKNTTRLGSGRAITLGNQIMELASLDDIGDVVEENKEDGAVPVWDELLSKYVVRKLDASDTDNDIDGGEF